ncbi:MAG: hypothetical protein C4326_12180 [Ignavibacteria bacterium]
MSVQNNLFDTGSGMRIWYRAWPIVPVSMCAYTVVTGVCATRAAGATKKATTSAFTVQRWWMRCIVNH